MSFADITKEKMNLLRTGIGMLVLVIAAVSWAGYRTVQDFRASNDVVIRTYNVLESLETMLTTVEATETGTRDFLLTKKREYLAPQQKGEETLQEQLQRVRALTPEDSWQQARCNELEELTTKLTKASKKTVEERNKSLAAALRAMRVGQAESVRADIRDLIGAMRAHERSLLAVRQRSASRRLTVNTVGCTILLLADIGFFVWVLVLSSRLNHLQRVIRVCAWTKKVEHEGQWITLEEYLQKTLDAPVSHGICEEAAETMMAQAMREAS